MRAQHSLLAQYHASLARYLQSREAGRVAPTPRDLEAALCRGRGALNFSGMGDPLGEPEQRAVSLLTPDELYRVVQGIHVEQLTARLRHFVGLSEVHGGDVSLVEPEDEQTALLAAGKTLLRERHDWACQLEGIRWWLPYRADLRAALEPALSACRSRLAQLDTLWQAHMAHFLPLNSYRRCYRDTYPQAQELWWWHQQADCDLEVVYQAAAGDALPSVHLQGCPDCQQLLRTLRGATSLLRTACGQPRAHPQPTDLCRFGHGERAGHEVAPREGHLCRCAMCREAVAALQHGDDPTRVPDTAVYVLPLPREALRAAAATQGVQGLPGHMLYQDEELEVWINVEGGHVILRVYGTNLYGLGTLDAIEDLSCEACPIVTIAYRPTEVVWELGSTEALRGKRVRLSLRLHDRVIALPLCDLIDEETP